MKKIILCILFWPLFMKAQLKNFTSEEAILKARTTLAPQTLKQLGWVKNTEMYAWVENTMGQERLMAAKADRNVAEPVCALSDLNASLRILNEDTLVSFPQIEWEDVSSFVFKTGKKRWLWVVASKSLEKKPMEAYPEDAQNADKDNRKGIIAYTRLNNLFLWNAGKSFAITNDEDLNIVNGQSVHRNEFGITKGTFWAPSGNYLAFYKMDQRMVADYPVTDFNSTPAKVKFIKYPMAGDTSHRVSVGIFDLKTLKTVFIKTVADDHYLTNISWSSDERTLYIAELNREQNHLKLNSYNTSTGEFVKTLFEEKDSKYVEPLNPMAISAAHPERFIWQSNRDGYNHLYLYENSGKLIRQLTSGKFEVTGFLGFDLKGDIAYFISNSTSPLNRDLYSVNLTDGKIQRLTEGEGTHKAVMNHDRTAFIDFYSSVSVPNIISVISCRGKIMKQLLKAPDPIAEYACTKPRIFALKSKDGTDLYCRMFLPAAFDSTKKYPVVVYLYGGPHVQNISNNWLGNANLWFPYMAQKGYVVFTLDNRGSDNRGKDFEQATFRQLGNIEMEDQMVGVKYLKSLKYVDSTRLGVHGWSFGGFMTTSLMTRYPGVFKVAVAGGPVIDWKMYEVMYTERYMDSPAENSKGYDENNLLNYADKLKGKLMLIHGTNDDVVVWQHSINFIRKCVDKGIPVDYFVYPGHEHNVLGKDRLHLMNKVSEYFFEHL